ncbi:MAG TPA: hypothetical protein PL010_13135 [Flavobacteriales bacterium]|nr:hypothetical protein [Flavobacteriales bacterium]HNA33109.1 hypothetical protein [Flavobacteriales bacterium]HNE81214.1 hypothetical protein [Flavobacteriales bacterium]HNI05563.1 hypothetical protein [Flavobacteriales bacterium]HNK39890.1 hypothetical protein [Flavobacteriales bacterium]
MPTSALTRRQPRNTRITGGRDWTILMALFLGAIGLAMILLLTWS